MRHICGKAIAWSTAVIGVLVGQAGAEEPQRLIGHAVMPKAECRLQFDGQSLEPTTKQLPLYVTGLDAKLLTVASRSGDVEFAVAQDQILQLDPAIEYYTARIAARPDDAWALEMRGLARLFRGDELSDAELKQALADYDAAIRLGRRSATTYADRSTVQEGLGHAAAALADLNEATRLDPKNTDFVLARAGHYLNQAQYDQAVADFEAALKIDPESATAHNDYAFVLATSPEARVRNGKRAVELALEACELDDWMNFEFLDTLAAAYAETGDFEKAVAMQRKAVEILGETDEDAAKEIKARLKLYQAGKPYRESAPGK